MPYLTRRIRQLLDDIKSDRIVFAPGVASEILRELERVRTDEEGNPILESCSPGVRSFARGYALASSGVERAGDVTSAAPTLVGAAEVSRLMRELFGLLADAFTAFTGTTPKRFVADGEEFDEAVRRHGRSLSDDPKTSIERFSDWKDALGNLERFYRASSQRLFEAALSARGAKFVMSGGATC